jgi:small conductance mechanosensitive channel
MEVIQEVAEDFRADPEMGEWVTDDPVMLGVDKFTESGAVIKFMVQTQPDKIFPTRRQLLRRIKNRFDEEGIQISVPHRILLQEKREDTNS